MQSRGAFVLQLSLLVAACGGKAQRNAAGSESDAPTRTSEETGGRRASNDCSDALNQRSAWLEETSSALGAAKLELTEQLAAACFRIADDLGFGPAELAAPPSMSDVENVCQSAESALTAIVADLATAPTIDRRSCACSHDPDVFYACLEPCEALGDTTCHDFCFCPTYCNAEGLARPNCNSCEVAIEVDHEALARTLGENLPIVYTVLDRADLAAWSADTLHEAGVELGYLFEEDACTDLVVPLDQTLRAAEQRASDLTRLVSAAAGVAEAL